MTKIPVLNYYQVIKALRRDGWVVVRQKGSHIRMHKEKTDGIMKITVPSHSPLKRSTLSHILKQADITIENFMNLL